MFLRCIQQPCYSRGQGLGKDKVFTPVEVLSDEEGENLDEVCE